MNVNGITPQDALEYIQQDNREAFASYFVDKDQRIDGWTKVLRAFVYLLNSNAKFNVSVK